MCTFNAVLNRIFDDSFSGVFLKVLRTSVAKVVNCILSLISTEMVRFPLNLNKNPLDCCVADEYVSKTCQA